MKEAVAIRVVCALVATGLIVNGCESVFGPKSATFGPKIAREAVESENYPKKGTPKDEVQAQWGPPNQYLKTPDGRDIWYYEHAWVRNPYRALEIVFFPVAPLLSLFFLRLHTDVWKVWITFDDESRVAEVNGTHVQSRWHA